MALNQAHNPEIGDLFIHLTYDGGRQIWVCGKERVWDALPVTAGLTSSTSPWPTVKHPTVSDLWLDFPLTGKPSWLKLETFSRRDRA